MAELRSSTSIGGNLVWHSGNLRFDTQGQTIRYAGYKIYTENDKPDPHTDLAIPAVKLTGDVMTGHLKVPNSHTTNGTNLVYGFGGSENRGSMQPSGSDSTEEIDRSGFVDWGSTMTDLPAGGWFWGFHTEHNNGNGYGMTLGWSQSTNKLFWRNKSGGAYGSWEEVFSSRDYSTLDARYAQTATNETITGNWTYTGTNSFSGATRWGSSYQGINLGSSGGVYQYTNGDVWLRSGDNRIGVESGVPSFNGARLTRVNQAENITGHWNISGHWNFSGSLKLSRSGLDNSEVVTAYVEDTKAVFSYQNDESVCAYVFKMTNSDTEGGNGVSANSGEVKFTQSTAGTELQVQNVYATGNLDVDNIVALKDLSSSTAGSVHLKGNNQSLRIQPNAGKNGYVDIGPMNTSHAHIYTDRPNFYFNKHIQINGKNVLTQDYFATTLDPVYVNKSGDSMSGHLTMGANLIYGNSTSRYISQNGNTAIVNPASISLHADSDSSNNNEYLDLKAGDNSLKIYGGGASSHDLKFNNNTVWHAGNDGSGSGLDADKLDGLQATDFQKINGTYIEKITSNSNHYCKVVILLVQRYNGTDKEARRAMAGRLTGQRGSSASGHAWTDIDISIQSSYTNNSGNVIERSNSRSGRLVSVVYGGVEYWAWDVTIGTNSQDNRWIYRGLIEGSDDNFMKPVAYQGDGTSGNYNLVVNTEINNSIKTIDQTGTEFEGDVGFRDNVRTYQNTYMYANGRPLKLYANSGSSSSVGIAFSSNGSGSWGQQGYIDFDHTDDTVLGSAHFDIGTTESSFSVNLNGLGRIYNRNTSASHGALRIDSPSWYSLNLSDSGATNGTTQYGIGRAGNQASRVLSVHIPSREQYGSTGIVPSFGVYSTGSDKLLSVNSASGNTYIKGDIETEGSKIETSYDKIWRFNASNEADKWYKIATVNRGNSGARLVGQMTNHVETNGAQSFDIIIHGRDGGMGAAVAINGNVNCQHPGGGILVVKADVSGSYTTYDVWAKLTKYNQGYVALEILGDPDMVNWHNGTVTSSSKPSGTVEFDSSGLSSGVNYEVIESVARRIATAGNSNISTKWEFASSVTSGDDDWESSPIVVRERGLVGSVQSANNYAPNICFHWGGKAANSLWMGANGVLNYGGYDASGTPSINGGMAVGHLYFDGHTYGLNSPSGTYGSVQTLGRKGNWGGFSIEGRAVFMHDGTNSTGIYDDVNNKWMFHAEHGGASKLFYNGSEKLATTDVGLTIGTIDQKRVDISASTNWDEIGFSKSTNLHFNGHNQFWVGAGNSTWFKGAANWKGAGGGISADATSAHDLLLTTMYSTSTCDRGITFAASAPGDSGGTNGWRLGKWHSGNAHAASMLVVDGTFFAKGGRTTNEYDYYGDDYSTYYDNGQPNWTGDGGWNKPSIVTAGALQIQSGNKTTGTEKPQIQFHQYGYGGPLIEYDGANKQLIVKETGEHDRLETFVVNANISGNWVTSDGFSYLSARGGTSSSRVWDGGSTRGHVFEQSTPLGSYYFYMQTGTSTNGSGNHCQINGSLTAANNITAYSDASLKENVVTVTDALDKVKQMRGVYYDRIDSGNHHVGVIAQEIEKVLPEVVTEAYDPERERDIKTVDYGNISAVLIEAIKEQQQQIEELQRQVNKPSLWQRLVNFLK